MCLILCHVFFFFFFKQKTAYEMRISDWSSDVCSSDLHGIGIHGLYSDNFYLGPQLLPISSDTGNQATTTDRDKNGVDGPRMLAQNLHAHRALPGDYEIGRAHVWTPVTSAHLVCRLLLEK